VIKILVYGFKISSAICRLYIFIKKIGPFRSFSNLNIRQNKHLSDKASIEGDYVLFLKILGPTIPIFKSRSPHSEQQTNIEGDFVLFLKVLDPTIPIFKSRSPQSKQH
jgi:hypothetical protein